MQNKEDALNFEEMAQAEKSYNRAGTGLIGFTDTDSIVLVQGSNEDFIDYTKCDAKVVRLPITQGQDKTIGIYPEGTFLCQCRTAKELSMTEGRDIIKQALQQEGYDVKCESKNDLVDSNGNKISGIIRFSRNDYTCIGFNITTVDATGTKAAESVHLPQEYMERKELDDAEERFGYIEDFDYKSFCRSLEHEFKERGIDMSFVDSKPEFENPEKHIEWRP
jgi:hypothetical protein